MELGQFSLGGKVESIGESADNADDDLMTYGAIVSYDFGVGALTAAAQRLDYDDETAAGQENRTEFFVNASYNVADNMYVYAEHGRFDQDEDEGDYFGIGTVYSF